MQFTWTDEEEAFRADLRSFLETVDLGKPPKDKVGRKEWAQRWIATLFDAGYAGPGWPKEYGGMELPFRKQVIYQEELARRRVPATPGNGVGMAGPTIIKHGTQAQRDRFLRPMLRADEIWAQAFSEPGAGSDLPGLRTTAKREGDKYVINGQKVWNTAADISDWMFALVRTGAPDSRQHGISYLLIDKNQPGVEVRPLHDMTDNTVFTEIFFTDAVTSVDNLVGAENEGWKIARTTLGHERSAGALQQAQFYRRVVTELIELSKERGVLSDPILRHRMADFERRVRVMRISAMRMIARIADGGDPGPISSVSRLTNALFEQQLHELAFDLLGPEGVYDGADAVQHGRWAYGYLRTRGSTIGAGTAEIQRNTIAEQVLGLPFDPAMPPR